MTDLPTQPEPGSPKSAWAAWAADFGRATGAFKVFRCRADDGTLGDNGLPTAKNPWLGERWKEVASHDRKTVEAMWLNSPEANIGLAIQPGFVAIDADLYKEGKTALLDAWEAEHGELPATLEFRSASGGMHLIYATERNLGNSAGTLPGFGDVRGNGGYIVGPGSTFGGLPYTVADLASPVALPATVDKCLVERKVITEDTHVLPPYVMLDDPVNITRYTLWLLRDARTGTAGIDRNNTLAATAAMGASYGLSEDETVHLISEHWNTRYEPAFTDEKLDKHGRSGYRTHSSKFGNMAERNPKLLGFKDARAGNPTMLAADIWRSMADIAGPAPAREWAAGTDDDGWVPLRGITLLYGAGGAGKTALVGQWALSQARGEPLFGVIPLRKMPVILIAAEDDEGELHRRFAAQGKRNDDDVCFAAVRGEDTALHPSFRGTPSGEDTWMFRMLDDKLASMPAGDKLVMLDNLAQIYQANYYEPSEIIRFLNGYLGRLSKRHDATIIVLAHPSESQTNSGTGSYGGVQWSAGVRARLYLEHHMTQAIPGRGGKPAVKAQEIGAERVFSRKKSNYAKSGASIVLDWDNWRLVPVGAKPASPAAQAETLFKERAATTSIKPIVEAAVATALASNTTSWSTRALAEKVARVLRDEGHAPMGDTTIRKYLAELKGDSRHYNTPSGSLAGYWRYVPVN